MTEHKKEPLPEWFDLKKYEKCSEFSVYDWWSEIARRVLAYEHWHIKSQRTRVTKLIQKFTEVPLLINDELAPDINKLIEDMEKPRCVFEFSKHAPRCNTTAVKAFDWLDVDRVLSVWEMDKLGRDSVDYFFYRLNNPKHKDSVYCKKLSSPVDMVIHSECHDETRAIVTIDLSMGNKQIINDIEKFLPIYREMLKKDITRKKDFAAIEISKFNSEKVLPILDMELWAMANGIDLAKKYGKKHIAAHLFGVGREKRYWDTARGTAIKFLDNSENIQILRHQASGISSAFLRKKTAK